MASPSSFCSHCWMTDVMAGATAAILTGHDGGLVLRLREQQGGKGLGDHNRTLEC